MVVVSEVVHPRGLSFYQQRRVVTLRDDQGLAWETIAERVKNLEGKPSTPNTVRTAYLRMKRGSGRAKYKYKNCGRRKILTKDLEEWLLKEFLKLRAKGVCTSVMLQRLLARKKRVKVEVSSIQKLLKRNGYRWLPRSKKVKYSEEQKEARKAFADAVLKLSDDALRKRMSMCMDGVVLSMPPTSTARRENWCRASETHCWRKPSEGCDPDLAGADRYKKQVPLARAIPLWGGASEDGFAPILWHAKHKLTSEEWVEGLQAGKLETALAALEPVCPQGPFFVLCDNEKFLLTEEACKEYRKSKVRLWMIPARSPDLNPIEKFWAWLRKQLLDKDLEDLRAGRAVPAKPEYRKRVQALLRTQRAHTVAGNCVQSFRKTCEQVSEAEGAASRG